MNKISIIIPVYNVERYILSCLESVGNQSMTDGVECILVDDCGNDNSIKIAEEYINNYRGGIEFSIVYHDINKGLSVARNSGINAASGQYVYFIDSDDTISKECIANMYQMVLKYPDVDYVQGTYEDVRDLKKFWTLPFPEYTEDRKLIKESMLNWDLIPINAQNRLVKRNMLIENNLFFKEGIIHEDNLWTFFLSKYVTKMAYCRKPGYWYTENPESITGNVNYEKEYSAWEVIFPEYCRNIDEVERGAQKSFVLYSLLVILRSKLYRSDAKKTEYIKLFQQHNTIVEKFFLRIAIFLNRPNTVPGFFAHLLSRLYKIYN